MSFTRCAESRHSRRVSVSRRLNLHCCGLCPVRADFPWSDRPCSFIASLVSRRYRFMRLELAHCAAGRRGAVRCVGAGCDAARPSLALQGGFIKLRWRAATAENKRDHCRPCLTSWLTGEWPVTGATARSRQTRCPVIVRDTGGAAERIGAWPSLI